MAEENDPLGEAVRPSLSQKTKEQWVDEGNLLAFYAPIRLEEGLVAYEQAIHLDSNYGLAYCMKGYICRYLKRYEESLIAYEQVTRLDGDPFYTWMAYLNSATILASFSRYEEALTACEGAIRFNPKLAPRMLLPISLKAVCS